jgi:uncharacterized membrane protein
MAARLTKDDRARIARAIAAAEDGTTGTIAVRIVNDKHLDAVEKAKSEFGHIGMHRHATANAALVLVAPRAHQFAVIGDSALHARVGDDFWKALTVEMRRYFAYDQMPEGILHAVERLGEQFRAHFPADSQA